MGEDVAFLTSVIADVLVSFLKQNGCRGITQLCAPFLTAAVDKVSFPDA
jgi:hypothetical protein